jgi:hypothetical protein
METLPGTMARALGGLAAGTVLHLVAAMLPPLRAGSWRLLGARALAVALSGAALAIPFGLDGSPLARALLAQALIVEIWRLIEILRTPERFARRERALRIVLLPYEYTFLERGARRWPLGAVAASTLLFGVAAVGLFGASLLAAPATPYAPAGWPRWLGATVAGYVVMVGMTWQWVAILPAFGFRHRPYQRHPILSRTLAEFWGVRWSSVINRWLRVNVYEPLARRRLPRGGVMAAFAASALLHAYIVLPAAGLVPALWMLAFFLVHGAGMIVEAALGVRRWRPLAGRAFVALFFALTVPLFMEPILRAIGL